MYSKEELKQLKLDFWQGFSDYCKGQPQLKNRKRTWMLYNTRVKGVELKFDLSRRGVAVVLEVNGRPSSRAEMMEKLGWYKTDLEKDLEGELIWAADFRRESGESVSRIYATQSGGDYHRRGDWAEMYRFMASRMFALERNLLAISDFLRE